MNIISGVSSSSGGIQLDEVLPSELCSSTAHCQQHVLAGYLAAKTVLSVHCLQNKAGTLTML